MSALPMRLYWRFSLESGVVPIAKQWLLEDTMQDSVVDWNIG